MYNEDKRINTALKTAMAQHHLNNNALASIMSKTKQATSNLLRQEGYTIETLNSILDSMGVPMVTPGGGLGAHIDARQVVSHIPAEQFPAPPPYPALHPAADRG